MVMWSTILYDDMQNTFEFGTTQLINIGTF